MRQQVLAGPQANRTLIFLPIYVSVSGTGANDVHAERVRGIRGHRLPPAGFNAEDWLNTENDCTGSDYCIEGYFIQGLVPYPGSLGGTNLGAYIIALTG